MSDDTEITSGKNGSLTWKKGKGISHTCLKVKEIEEIHTTLFKDAGLVEEVTLINDRQQKALKVLDNIEKDLKFVMTDLAEMKGETIGEKELAEKIKIEKELKATRMRDIYWRIAQTILIIIAVITVTITVKRFKHDTALIKDELHIKKEIKK